MSTLYLDCVSGISGDMTVGALLDLGADPEALRSGLASLALEGWTAETRKGMKGALSGTAFRVRLDPEAGGAERTWPDIRALIEGAAVPERVRRIALAAFRHLAEAEGSVHGIPPEQVHFHEVGAVDSIVDIVGAAICLDQLAPGRVVVSPIPMARGFVRCRHGLIPLPAPATLALAQGMPICRPPQPTTRELATPTGLALAKAAAEDFGDLPVGVVRKTGYGLGQADLPWPNVLRAVLLDEASCVGDPDKVLQLEANLDDMTAEALAHALDRLMAEGALDAWLTPIHMKKGRPGFTLGMLCRPSEGERFAALVLRETTTLGVRYGTLDRRILPREMQTVATKHGVIHCKLARLADGSVRIKPEFEDCRKAAEAVALPLSAVEEEARLAARRQLGL